MISGPGYCFGISATILYLRTARAIVHTPSALPATHTQVSTRIATTPHSLAALAPHTGELGLAKRLWPFEVRQLSSVSKLAHVRWASWLTIRNCASLLQPEWPRLYAEPPAPSLDRRGFVLVGPAFAEVGVQ